MSTTGDVINMCNRVVNFFQPLMPNSSHFTTKRLKNAKNIAQVKQLSYGYHHHIYFPTQSQQKSQKIAIQSEGCQRSLTAHGLAAQVKNINYPQIILSYNKGANKKQQHSASAIGHVQYHHFIYNNHNSHNTIAR